MTQGRRKKKTLRAESIKAIPPWGRKWASELGGHSGMGVCSDVQGLGAVAMYTQELAKPNREEN